MTTLIPVRLLLLATALAILPAATRSQTAIERDLLAFEPAATPATWVARADGVTWWLRGGTLLANTAAGQVVLRVQGSRDDGTLEPGPRVPGCSHYYLGSDPTSWRTDVPRFASLRAIAVLPDVDLVLHAAGRHLEFDFVVAPNAPARDLRLEVTGASPQLVADGAVELVIGDGCLRLHAPVAWQTIGGRRVPVAIGYEVAGDEVRLALGSHDAAHELIVDPVVTFSTLLGGNNGQDNLRGVHLDRQGNVLVTGTTQASTFPLQNNLPYPWRNNIGFVSKFDGTGALVFSTFFGGTTGNVAPVDIGADPDGQIVVGGNTTCPDLPTTAGVVQPTLVGGGDWFFVDLLVNGTLNWCTYYGGPGVQNGMRCLEVLDVQRGSVLAVGNEGGFPFMTNAYSQTGNVVCAGIAWGNVLWASTACGFSGTPTAVDVTSQGHIVLTGTVVGTGSGLPTTAGSLQPNAASPGGVDGFVFAFTGQANSLVFATYFGGTSSDQPRAIHARPGAGTIVVTIVGNTSSVDLPVHNAIQPQKGAGQDGFVAQFDSLTQTLAFSTYLGGSDPGESVSGVGIDGSGHVVVAGEGSSTNLPFRNPLKLPSPASNRDVVLWRLSPTGALDWCTNYGGNGSELLIDLMVAANGEFVIGGTVSASNWPSTPNALPAAFLDQDAFVTRFDPRSMTSYGAGTAGSGGFVPVLAGGGAMAIGTTALLQLHDGFGGQVGFLAAGFGRTNTAFFGGTLLVNPLVIDTIVLRGPLPPLTAARGGGYLHLGFPIPNLPSAVGTVVDWQAAVMDPIGSGGIALTNGIELVVR